MNKQLELFEKIKMLKYKLQSIAGYVQNDFDMMIKNGYTDKSGIKNMIPVMEKEFDDMIIELNEYKEQCRDLMEQSSS